MKFNAAPAATATSDAANTFRETIKAPAGRADPVSQLLWSTPVSMTVWPSMWRSM